MVLVKATASSEAGEMPEPWASEMMAAMGRFNDELRAAGVLVMAAGLAATAEGKRVAFDGAARNVIDGPFLPPEAQVAGFWLWDVADMAEALAWVKRCPNPMPVPSVIEIRPLHGGA
jgi:hypothetical protein